MTTTYLSSDITDAWMKLKAAYSELASCENEIFYIDQKQTFSVCTKYQSIFRLQFDNPAIDALHQQCMFYLLRAEQLGPGSFDVCLKKLVSQKPGSPTSGGIKESLVPSREHLRAMINEYVSPRMYGNLNEMIWDALELAGFGGKIIVERTSAIPHIERASGYSFSLKPAIELPQKTMLRNANVVCLDAHLDDVSQAHFLFEQIAESQQPCVLFVRELSNDIKHTIKVNYDRGTMRIVPFTVTFDLEQANTLVDLAVVSGNDVVSRQQASVISQIKLSDHRSIDRIDIRSSDITIFNKATLPSVQRHLKNLQDKRADTPYELQHLIDGRIRSLMSNSTIMRIHDDANFTFRAQLIDFALRSVKAALDYGVEYDSSGRVRPASLDVIAHAFESKLRESVFALGAIVT